jgi:hypothetical protein
MKAYWLVRSSMGLFTSGLTFERKQTMGWFDYYRLLEEYDGDWTKVPHEAKVIAAHRNPNDPTSAFALARKKYDEAHPEHVGDDE